MTGAVLLGALIAVFGFAGPIFIAHLTGRQRHSEQAAESERRRREKLEEAAIRKQEKQEDWARQDEVARRAAEVADQLLEKQKETAAKTAEAAALLIENNEVVAKTARITNTKLDVIHTLVNSNVTTVLQSELDAKRGHLMVLKEVIALRVELGQEPDPQAAGELAALEKKVKELAANLQERLEQTKVADAQIFIAKERDEVRDDFDTAAEGETE